MDCFNHNCPIRNNTTSSPNRCECITCPNRRETYTTTYVSNHTLTADELAILRANMSREANNKIQ